MKRFLLAALLLLNITTFSMAQSVNIDAKLENAKKDNKHLMVFFHIPHCPYCKRMLDKNFKDEKVLGLIEENFILVDLFTADSDQIILKDFKGTIKEFAKHIGAVAYPATIYLDPKGEIVFRSIGYRNIIEYIPEIKYIATKSYKNKDFEAYKLELEMADDE